MINRAVNVAIVDGKTVIETRELKAAGPGSPVRIKAIADGKYLLAEGDRGVAPQNITVKRVGKDLHVTLEGGDLDQPQLIIEGFFDAQGQLIGMAEDGTFHPYIASDARQDHSAAFLIEDVSAPQVLATESVAGMGSGLMSTSGVSWLSAGLIGLAGLGVLGVAYAASNKDDDKDDPLPALSTPRLGGIYDNVGGKTGLINSGDATDDTTPTFTGIGNPGNTIVIRDGDKIIGEVIVGADGTWSFTPPAPLSDGPHSITFTERDPLGNESAPSPALEFTVDLTAPGKVSISDVLNDIGGHNDPIAQNGITNDSTPTLKGQAEAGSTVEIFANGVKIGEAPVDASGNWVFTPTAALADGSYAFTVVAVDAAGNRGLASDPYALTIDTSAPGKPGEGGLGSIDTVFDDVELFVGPVANGGLTNDNTPMLSGSHQQPGDTVNIRDNGTIIGSVIVDSQGNWSFTPEVPLTDGRHELSLSVTDPAGNTSEPSDPYVIDVETQAPGKPGEGGNGGFDSVIDDVEVGTGEIANGGLTNDNTPTFSGGNQQPGDTVTISDNGVFLGSAVVQPDGTWSFTPETPLDDGTHEFVLVVNDPAGNASEPSEPFTIIIETEAPLAQATVDSMGKDSGSVDFVTNDGSAGRLYQGTLTATLAADEKVQVSTDGGVSWFDAQVNADGTWSYVDLTAHTSDWSIRTRVVDEAGNFNASRQDVNLDTVAPTAPTSLEFNGATVTVNFDGNGVNVGDTIQVIVGNQRFEVQLTQAQIDAGSVDVTTVAGAAMTNTEAKLIDTAGNASQRLMPSLEIVDFDSVPLGGIPADSTQDFGAFTFNWGGVTTSTSPLGVIAEGTVSSGFITPSRGVAFFTTATLTNPSIVLNGGIEASAISFVVGQATRPITLNFYAADGELVHSVDLPPVPTGVQEVNFQLPEGQTFTRVEFDGTDNDWLWVDDFKFSNGSFEHSEVPAAQSIVGTGAYYGDEADNVFAVSDVAHLNDASSVINGEGGLDTLELTGGGQTLNLENIAGKLQSIEVIDITGTGNNMLNLSLGDVLEQGQRSLFVDDDRVQVMVKGNAGDVVNLNDVLSGSNDPGDWTPQGNVTVGGVVYDVYSHSTVAAELLVQQGVTTNLV